MRGILIGLSLALVLLGVAPGRADPAADELLDIFAGLCFGRFPDETAVRQYASEKGLAVMPAEQLRHLLGTDPGEGWLQNAAQGQYLVTIEMPPYHACAIRKPVSTSPDIVPAFSRVLGAWAAKQPGTSLKEDPPQTVNIDGLPSQAYVWNLERGAGEQVEALMLIVTKVSDLGTEVRLVRSIGNR